MSKFANESALRLAERCRAIAPFFVMEIVKEAEALAATGRSIIHMSIGEPDFTAAPLVRAAAIAAIERGTTQYTSALGIAPLREALARHYLDRFGVAVDPARIVVTAGASAALLLAVAALVERGAEVLVSDPSYPCNRHFISVFDGRPQLVPCDASTRFQLDAASIARHWGPATRGVLLATPSNPTGTTIAPAALAAIAAEVAARNGFLLVDEIYQGLTYGVAPTTALALQPAPLVINSFSKYFGMTGWRLGWLVAPPAMMTTLETLAQNLYICPSAIAQQAALACFEPASLALYEDRRREFERRRDFLIPALERLGLTVPVRPDGAFYVYVDISRWAEDSTAFARELLRVTGVCVVPGADFGNFRPQRFIRISYATPFDALVEAIDRIERFLEPRRTR